jgi:hypothetical protein
MIYHLIKQARKKGMTVVTIELNEEYEEHYDSLIIFSSSMYGVLYYCTLSNPGMVS